MNGHFFITALALSVVLSMIFSIFSLKKGVSGEAIIKNAVLISIISIPIVGQGTGTFYSHGFDIPWFFFGIINSWAIILMVGITLLIYKYVNKK